jgi:hypothetical protein
MTNTQTKTKEQYSFLEKLLNERQYRLYLASEAKKIGRGGRAVVAYLSGVSTKRIARGLADMEAPPLPDGRIRRPGAGRKKTITIGSPVDAALEELLDPKGDPMSPIRWTTKSLSKLEDALGEAGYIVSYRTIGRALKSQGFSLQANKKNIEGRSHPDRDGQFHLINTTVKDFLAAGDPVISVDCKKKELIGNFKNNGREWQPKGGMGAVNVYDFPSLADGKAVPYGIYDRLTNMGFVNVGTNADTSAFAVESIRRWWQEHGTKLYPNAKRLLITCDGGGSNGSRNRLWKRELQTLVNEIGIPITIRHYPPATSKWNAIEHKLFSYISINWRGRPLTSLETVIDLISHTTTKTGLTITAVPDMNIYEKGIKISDAELAALNIRKRAFHGEWTYMVGVQLG